MELINQTAILDYINDLTLSFLKKHKPEPRTAGLTKETRQDLFHGKSAEWIRVFIFDRYPETDLKNGGWVLNPRRSSGGKSTSILYEPAKKWLNEHEYEIDWNERLDR